MTITPFLFEAEDCKALALLKDVISGLIVCRVVQTATGKEAEVVCTDDLKHPLVNKWREFSSPLSELEEGDYGDVPGEALDQLAAEIWDQDDRHAPPTHPAR